MKSYKNLYKELISEENIKLGIANSSIGKRDRPEVFETFIFQDEYIDYYKRLINNLPVYKHTPVQIYDGITRKVRHIIVPSYKEQVVHHCLVNVLKPIFFNSMYTYSCGSLPNRGAHFAKTYIQKAIKKDYYNTKYCLKIDIKKFFDNIDHNILKNRLSKKIKDKKFLEVLFRVIDVTENGLPLGFYTSQWLANWYLSELDHIIKEKLKVKYYVRYMDDMVMFGHSKKELHEIRKYISSYLKENLNLELKKNWQVFLFDDIDEFDNHSGRLLDFMGFKFYRNKVTLRKNIMFKASRKAKKLYKKDKVTVYDCKQMLSYLGWIDCTNTYNMYFNYIKPYISYKYCRKRVSKYDKRLSEWRTIKNALRLYTLYVYRGASVIGFNILTECSIFKKKYNNRISSTARWFRNFVLQVFRSKDFKGGLEILGKSCNPRKCSKYTRCIAA